MSSGGRVLVAVVVVAAAAVVVVGVPASGGIAAEVEVGVLGGVGVF